MEVSSIKWMPLLCFGHNLNLWIPWKLRQGLELLDCADVGVCISHRWYREHKVLLRFLSGREFSKDGTRKGKIIFCDPRLYDLPSYLMSFLIYHLNFCVTACITYPFKYHCRPSTTPWHKINVGSMEDVRMSNNLVYRPGYTYSVTVALSEAW